MNEAIFLIIRAIVVFSLGTSILIIFSGISGIARKKDFISAMQKNKVVTIIDKKIDMSKMTDLLEFAMLVDKDYNDKKDDFYEQCTLMLSKAKVSNTVSENDEKFICNAKERTAQTLKETIAYDTAYVLITTIFFIVGNILYISK